MANTARNGVNEGAEPRRSTAIEPSHGGRPKIASSSDEHGKPRSYQRFVLTDPVAFRYLQLKLDSSLLLLTGRADISKKTPPLPSLHAAALCKAMNATSWSSGPALAATQPSL